MSTLLGVGITSLGSVGGESESSSTSQAYSIVGCGVRNIAVCGVRKVVAESMTTGL